MESLRGTRIPGGRFRIADYQSRLLYDIVGVDAEPEPHPIFGFVMAMSGTGMSIGEILALMGSDGADGPMLGSCALNFHTGLKTEQDYVVDGGVVDVQRKDGRVLGTFDAVSMRFEVRDAADPPVVTADMTFVVPRSSARGTTGRSEQRSLDSSVTGPESAGSLPAWHLDEVDPQRMKMMALLLGDPNPIHWDADLVRALGLGKSPINQGPVNLAYILNMIRTAYPRSFVSRLDARLLGNVFAGDRVVAGGRTLVESPTEITCEAWLDRYPPDGSGPRRAVQAGVSLRPDPATQE